MNLILIIMLVLSSFRAVGGLLTCKSGLNVRKSVASRSRTRRDLTTTIYIVGKKTGGEEWIATGIEEYEKRLRPSMTCKTTFCKTDDDLVKAFEAAWKKKGAVFALDEKGEQYTSRDFSTLVFGALIEGGSNLSVFIGGASGLPRAIRTAPVPKISLSKMTWTHQHARLLLMEQLYRATEIRKGSNYHKD